MYGEKIVYRPFGGIPRSITAIVNRDPPESLAGVPGAVAPRLTIEALDHPWEGIPAGTVLINGDKVDVRLKKGGPITTETVTNVIRDDAGSVEIEIH